MLQEPRDEQTLHTLAALRDSPHGTVLHDLLTHTLFSTALPPGKLHQDENHFDKGVKNRKGGVLETARRENEEVKQETEGVWQFLEHSGGWANSRER